MWKVINPKTNTFSPFPTEQAAIDSVIGQQAYWIPAKVLLSNLERRVILVIVED